MMRLSRSLQLVLAAGITFCCVGLFSSCSWAASKQSMLLNQGWQFRQLTDLQGIAHNGWLLATVPGDVHLDLLRNKLIPQPFYRDNETKLQWIENADWEYRTTIPASEKLLSRQNIDLVFDGLDTCAQVYLNGNLLLTSDNMFRTYRLNAKPYLKAGNNQLRIVFTSRDVYVSFGNHDAKFSDNYIDLLPGEPATIVVHSPASLAELQNSMKVVSLADAIEPNTVWKNASGD